MLLLKAQKASGHYHVAKLDGETHLDAASTTLRGLVPRRLDPPYEKYCGAHPMIDEAEAPASAIDPAFYERLRSALASKGPKAAVEQLIAELRKAEDFQNLFYALLLKKRVELGVSPFPTGPSTELPPATHEPYEQAIRDAGREVGHALLERKQTARRGRSSGCSASQSQ